MASTNVCPVFRIADLIGKKWTIALIQEVDLNGEKGFNAISKHMKSISPKILSKRLKELETEGILKRDNSFGKPAKTSYELTEKGKDLQKVISILKKWERELCPNEECTNCPLYYC